MNERKPTHGSTREELKRWQTWAKEKIKTNKESFSSFDSGGSNDSDRHYNDPVDEQSLVTELEWLLEDVVLMKTKYHQRTMKGRIFLCA